MHEINIDCVGTLPCSQTAGSAGYDLFAAETVELIDGHVEVIPTNTFVEIPKGYVGLVCSRSGLAAKQGVFVLNAPGIVDSDYRGELKVIVSKMPSTKSVQHRYTITKGDKLAQLVIVPVASVLFMATDGLSATTRGTAGFGSTGR